MYNSCDVKGNFMDKLRPKRDGDTPGTLIEEADWKN